QQSTEFSAGLVGFPGGAPRPPFSVVRATPDLLLQLAPWSTAVADSQPRRLQCRVDSHRRGSRLGRIRERWGTRRTAHVRSGSWLRLAASSLGLTPQGGW